MKNTTTILACVATALVAGAAGFIAGKQGTTATPAAIASPPTSVGSPPAAATAEMAPAAPETPKPEKPAEPPTPPPAPIPETPPPPPDPWTVSEDKSEIDDTPRVVLITHSDVREDRFGNANMSALIVRCQENDTEVYINANDYLGLDSTDVTIRIDDEKASTSSWGISTDNKAMFAPNSIALVRKMLDRSSLKVRFTPYSESPVTLTFDITRLREHLPKVAAACKWKM